MCTTITWQQLRAKICWFGKFKNNLILHIVHNLKEKKTNTNECFEYINKFNNKKNLKKISKQIQ